MIDAKKKYIKYKKKYLDLVQKGGVAVYNPYILENKFVKMKYDDLNNVIMFSNVDARSNNFTLEQKRDIDVFINYILPFFKRSDGSIIGPSIIKDIEVLSAGSFGITLVFEKVIFKILKVDFMNINTIVFEVNTAIALFYNDNGIKYNNIPDSINLVYGYLTSNPVIWEKIHPKSQMSNDFINNYLYTSVDKLIDFNKLIKATETLKRNQTNIMNGNIVILLLDKADISLNNYFEIFNNEIISRKINILLKFYQDMDNALNYIHNTRKYIHNDIKPENIVVKFDNNAILFQLIDFGLLQKISNVNEILPRQGGTPIYFVNSYFKKNTNVLYDWHCILITILIFLNVIQYNKELKIFTIDNQPFIYDQSIQAKLEKKLKDLFGSMYSTTQNEMSTELSEVNNTFDIFNKLFLIIMYNYTLQLSTSSISDKIIELDKLIR